MKVRKVEPYTARDNTPRHRVHFENDDRPLILGEECPYNPGDEIPNFKLQLRRQGDNQYYILKEGPNENPHRDKSTCLSYAKDLCVAGKIELDEIIDKAKEFYGWVKS